MLEQWSQLSSPTIESGSMVARYYIVPPFFLTRTQEGAGFLFVSLISLLVHGTHLFQMRVTLLFICLYPPPGALHSFFPCVSFLLFLSIFFLFQKSTTGAICQRSSASGRLPAVVCLPPSVSHRLSPAVCLLPSAVCRLPSVLILSVKYQNNILLRFLYPVRRRLRLSCITWLFKQCKELVTSDLQRHGPTSYLRMCCAPSDLPKRKMGCDGGPSVLRGWSVRMNRISALLCQTDLAIGMGKSGPKELCELCHGRLSPTACSGQANIQVMLMAS